MKAGVRVASLRAQAGGRHGLLADFARLPADLSEQILEIDTQGRPGGHPSPTTASVTAATRAAPSVIRETGVWQGDAEHLAQGVCGPRMQGRRSCRNRICGRGGGLGAPGIGPQGHGARAARLLHGHALSLQTGAAHVLGDLFVARGQCRAQQGRQLRGDGLGHIIGDADLNQAVEQGLGDQLGAQGVALRVGVVEQARDVAAHGLQRALARVRNRQCQAVSLNIALDLGVVHQGQGGPVRVGQAVGAGVRVALQASVHQRLEFALEALLETGGLESQLAVGGHQQLPLHIAGAGCRLGSQLHDGLIQHARYNASDASESGLQHGIKAWVGHEAVQSEVMRSICPASDARFCPETGSGMHTGRRRDRADLHERLIFSNCHEFHEAKRCLRAWRQARAARPVLPSSDG